MALTYEWFRSWMFLLRVFPTVSDSKSIFSCERFTYGNLPMPLIFRTFYAVLSPSWNLKTAVDRMTLASSGLKWILISCLCPALSMPIFGKHKKDEGHFSNILEKMV